MSMKAVAGAVLAAGAFMWLLISWPIPDGSTAATPAGSFAPTPLPLQPRAAGGYVVAAPAQPTTVAPVEPQPQPTAVDPQLAPPDAIDSDHGPVAEYRARYEKDSRDSAAQNVETVIHGAFAHSRTPDLFQSASCRKDICKVLIRWSPERSRDYIVSIAYLGVGARHPFGHLGFDVPLALSPVSDKDSDGTRLVELYLQRRHTAQPLAAE